MIYKKTTFTQLQNDVLNVNGYTISLSDNKLIIDGSSSFVYGLGERYNGVNQKGLTVQNKVTEQFCNQGDKTYFPLPFFMVENNTGFFINTKRVFTYTFNDQIIIDIRTLETDTEIYILSGTYKDMVKDFITLTGEPLTTPKWTLGPWMSAHRWRSEDMINDQLDLLEKHELPITSLVIEQWSDEATFYTINEAEYEPSIEAKSYSEYTYHHDSLWPNPKKMVEKLHDAGIKALLWQAPVVKELEPKDGFNKQHEIDQKYVVENNLIVTSDTTPYQIPEGNWFPGSMIPDFTNPETVKWWFDKRQYLMDIGFDGYKTDGGEFVHDENTSFYSGETGKEMINDYSRIYIEEYKNHLTKNQVLFSRAGYLGQQSNSIQWSGDQKSTWEELQAMYSAGLSVSLSGQHLWSFDIGGFAGDLPSVELYKRATQLAVFSPIMQFHSEPVGGQFALLDPSEVMNNERSPWNIAEVYNDETVIAETKKLYWLRMNILPHIHSELLQAINQKATLMKHMIIEYPEDKHTHLLNTQHLLGNLLVVPVLEQGLNELQFYLPKGTWTNIFTDNVYQGNQQYKETISENEMTVFIKQGSALITQSQNLFDKADNSLSEETLYAHLYGTEGTYTYLSEVNHFTITWKDNKYQTTGKTPKELIIIFK